MNENISILVLGDVIGKPGREAVINFLTKSRPEVDLIITNVENSSHGFGITEQNILDLEKVGVKVFTGGNHTFDRKEVFSFIDKYPHVLRPANYPEGTPGNGSYIIDVAQVKVAVINIQGRVFMEPLRSPFLIVDEIIAKIKDEVKIIIVDMHAEATAEKVAMGWYLDGKVSTMLGTHTHVQTADERILPGGTAYITDIGCCGPINGVIGMEKESVFRRLVKQLPSRLEVADGPAAVSGIIIEINKSTGRASRIERVYQICKTEANSES
jgi:metallophosphoesterase (TIGR00282 family)